MTSILECSYRKSNLRPPITSSNALTLSYGRLLYQPLLAAPQFYLWTLFQAGTIKNAEIIFVASSFWEGQELLCYGVVRKSVNRNFRNCRIYPKLGRVYHDRLTRSQSASFVRKILVFISKWLPFLSCVDFQGGNLWFLEGKHRFSIL